MRVHSLIAFLAMAANSISQGQGSEVFKVTTGDPTPQNPPSEPGNLITAGFRGFTVIEVPEPSVTFLAFLLFQTWMFSVWIRESRTHVRQGLQIRAPMTGLEP